MPKAKKPAIAVVGDLHANSTVGLMPPQFKTGAGNIITANPDQKFLWDAWTDYCAWLDEWQIEAIVINGDLPQGINPRDAQTLSSDESDQVKFVLECLKPLIYQGKQKRTDYIYITRGTGFHSGKNGAREEIIAQMIGAVQDHAGAYSRYRNLIRWRSKILHFTHHISHASVYPYTPLARAQREARERAALGDYMPDVDVRSHVHVCNAIQSNDGRWVAVAPAWQLSTEFGHKVAPASLPTIGGLLICQDETIENQLRVLKRLCSCPRQPILDIPSIL